MKTRKVRNDWVDRIMAFEAGNLGKQETIELIQELIDNGLVSQLQGYYGRLAQNLIEGGICHE